MLSSDRRRILVPPSAHALQYVDSPAISISATDDAHKIYLQPHILSDANGSAYFEHQQTKVLVLVSGPKPQRSSFSSSAKLVVEVKFLPVSSSSHTLGLQQGQGYTTTLERTLADYVYASLVPSIRLIQYPKSAINVSVVVLSGPPAWTDILKQIAAACVTTASVAVVDSGIEVIDLVSACAMRFGTDGETNSFAEFDVDENAKALPTGGRAVVSYMAARDEITGFWVDEENYPGDTKSVNISLQGEYAINILRTACDGAKEVRKFVNGVLLQTVEDAMQMKYSEES
ncbi:3' exoribonuclease family, domain 1-domain-containing protein [Limtongia smithiae]|uniref:3' exoribonuclease family, domain 1-domain-containing protein n=1 Tax=Limtongia smithiae TaxID=1125753 RepID=UPI0034CE0E89